jgi:hypothetical protein
MDQILINLYVLIYKLMIQKKNDNNQRDLLMDNLI